MSIRRNSSENQKNNFGIKNILGEKKDPQGDMVCNVVSYIESKDKLFKQIMDAFEVTDHKKKAVYLTLLR